MESDLFSVTHTHLELLCLLENLASPVAQWVKHPPAMQEMQVQPLGQEDPLEEEMATHSSIIAWKIPWTEESSWPQSMGITKRHN